MKYYISPESLFTGERLSTHTHAFGTYYIRNQTFHGNNSQNPAPRHAIRSAKYVRSLYQKPELAMLRTTFALFIAATLAFISAAENSVIFFSLIVSWGENGYNSSGVVPAIDMALEAIESRQILPEYNLTYAIVQNSKVIQ